MLLTANDCLRILGLPEKENSMKLFYLPTKFNLKNSVIPKKVYCNVRMIHPLIKTLTELDDEGLLYLIESWDGIFNIRKSKGSAAFYSLHAWGVALDINAKSNGYGVKPTLNPQLVAVFKKNGFDWGGEWKKPDGMHFQLTKIVFLAGV